MATNVYTSLAARYDPVLTASIGQVVSTSLASVSGVVVTVLTLFIITVGVMMIMHDLHWRVAVNRLLRATAVSTLLTAASYNQFVQQPFLTDIPAWIGQSVGNLPANATVATQFDLLLDAVTHEGAAVKQQAKGVEGAVRSFEVDVIIGVTGAVLDVIFLIYEFTRFIVGLTVCVGPFIIMCLLFDYTRSFADRWVSKLIGAMILQLMYIILVQVMIRADSQFLITMEGMQTNGVDEQITNLVNIVVFFFMGAGVAVLIPGSAAFIGGGVALSPSALTRLPGNLIRLARTSASK